jgi:hypothetical protein
MGRKVFVSYKYGDTLVPSLNKKVPHWDGQSFTMKPRLTRVRDYVDILQDKIGKDHVNLGEKDGESLKDFSEGKIESHLKKKIYRSSVTIVMISKGMKDPFVPEKEQWIPWEISYSLRVVNRSDSSSQMNAVLGVVLPDENNSFNWYYEENPECKCVTHNRGQLFDILKSNMFNLIKPELSNCRGLEIFPENGCFIETVKWDLMINNHNYCIDKAIAIRDDHQKNNSYIVQIEMD